MNYRSLALFVCVLAAHAQPNNGWPTGRKYWPWDLLGWQYCAYHYTVQGGHLTETPEPNVPITTAVSVQQSSGWHTHDTGFGRPTLALRTVTPANSQTGSDGCVTATYKATGYSGWYTLESTTSGDLRFSPKGVNSYLGYYEHGLNGGERDLIDLLTPEYTMFEGMHDDTRHKDRSGLTGFSRFGSWESVGLMVRIAAYYEWGGNGLLLDIVRGSLPDGGIADNEYPSSGPYLFNPWVARQQEGHMYGVEWDIANPRIQAGGDVGHFALFSTILDQFFAGCKLGKYNQNGVPLAGGSGIYDYWSNQDVVHFACGSAPGSAQ